MEITSAEFVVSNSRADMCPATHLPEYAFIGRSVFRIKFQNLVPVC